MTAAERIRLLSAERCSVAEISEAVGVPRWYVRQTQRWWGYRAPTRATYPDTPAKMRHARRVA